MTLRLARLDPYQSSLNPQSATMTLQAAVAGAAASSVARASSAGYSAIVAPLAAAIIPATFAPRPAQAAATKTCASSASTSTSTAGSISTKLLEAWYSSVPQFMRFGTAASLGNSFFFAADVVIYKHVVTKLLPLEGEDGAASTPMEWLPDLFHRNRESVSFFLAYLVQISIQHLLNAWLVYGLDTISTREKYWSTLGGSYAAYATTLVASTIMNGYLLSLGWDKNVAFWGTICGFGAINYLLLTLVVTGDDDDGGKGGGGDNKSNRIPRGGGGGGINSRAAFVGNERRSRRICFTSIDDLDSTRAMIPDGCMAHAERSTIS